MNTTTSQTDPINAAGQHDDDIPPEYEHRSLYRPARDRMVAGVASGAARYLGVDVLVVRIMLVVLCFVGGAGVPLYVAGWLLIPDEGAEQSIAADLLGSRPGTDS